MVSCYLDPFVFACPSGDCSLETIQQFVEDLLRWRDVRVASPVKFMISADTHEVLIDTGSYPLWEPLKQSLSSLGITHIQPKDVIDVAHGILAKLPTVGDAIGIDDILFRIEEFRCPGEIERRHPTFIGAAAETQCIDVNEPQRDEPGIGAPVCDPIV